MKRFFASIPGKLISVYVLGSLAGGVVDLMNGAFWIKFLAGGAMGLVVFRTFPRPPKKEKADG